MKTLFAGWDQSVNHGAVVVLDEAGKLVDFRAMSLEAKDARKLSQVVRPDVLVSREFKKADADVKDAIRLKENSEFVYDTVGYVLTLPRAETGKVYFGIEDYALSKGQGAHQIGEVGGLVRLVLWQLQVPYRRVGPTVVKKVVAGNGDATKSEVKAALEKGAVRCPPLRFDCEGLSDALVEDLYDAAAVAGVIRLEWMVRSGAVSIASLGDHERDPFLRTSQHYPVNLLARPWTKENR